MRTLRILAAFGVAAALTACGSSGDSGQLNGPQDPGQPGNPVDPGTQGGGTAGGGTNGGGSTGGTGQESLDKRVVDYGEALRTASLKLVGELPTLTQIKGLDGAADKKAFYEGEIDKMLADPRFANMMIKFWKDTFKTGQTGTVQAGRPNMDSAALFAASVVVGDRPYTDLFTATAGTCPTFANGTFTAADCTPIALPNNGGGGGTDQASTIPSGVVSDQISGPIAQRLVDAAQQVLSCSVEGGHDGGHCLAGVSTAMEMAGLQVERGISYAKDYAEPLSRNPDFHEVPADGPLQPGDIIVHSACGGHDMGHIGIVMPGGREISDVERFGQNAGDAVGQARADRFCAAPRQLVAPHHPGDVETLAPAVVQQLLGRTERMREYRRVAHRHGPAVFVAGDDEAATHGEIRAALQLLSTGSKGREAQAVGMEPERLAAPEQEIA